MLEVARGTVGGLQELSACRMHHLARPGPAGSNVPGGGSADSGSVDDQRVAPPAWLREIGLSKAILMRFDCVWRQSAS